MRKCQVQTVASDKGVETYNLNFFAILEINTAGLEGKATRLMASRHSVLTISGPKVSK